MALTNKPVLLSGVALALAGVVTALFTYLDDPVGRFWLKRCGPVIHETQSAFSHIRVREKDSVRSLMFVRPDGGEARQTAIDLNAPAALQLAYTRFMFASFLHRQQQDRVLIVGLGGGGMVRFLNEHFPNTQIDAVEIDPAVVIIADQYFQTRSGPNTRIITEDAFAFLKRDDIGQYDVIYMDAFLKPSEDTDADGAPQRLRTVAFLKSLQERLIPEGVVVFNVIENDSTPSNLQSIRDAFGEFTVYRADRTRNLAVTTSRPSEEALRQSASSLDETVKLPLSFTSLIKGREANYGVTVGNRSW